MRLVEYLYTEMAILSKHDEWNFYNFMDDLRRMDMNDDVLWRGWRGGSKKIGRMHIPDLSSSAPIIKVGSQRITPGAFFGNWGKYNTEYVLKGLGLTGYSPVFTTKDYSRSKFFGTPYVVVPVGNFTSLYNPEVDDLLSVGVDWEKRNKTGIVPTYKEDFDETVLENLVKGYKEVQGIPKSSDSDKCEIMVLTKEYWLLSPATYIDMTKGKLKVYKNASEIRTYNDLYVMMEGYLTFYRWKARKDIEENPQFKERFLAPGGKYGSLPKNWFKDMK